MRSSTPGRSSRWGAPSAKSYRPVPHREFRQRVDGYNCNCVEMACDRSALARHGDATAPSRFAVRVYQTLTNSRSKRESRSIPLPMRVNSALLRSRSRAKSPRGRLIDVAAASGQQRFIEYLGGRVKEKGAGTPTNFTCARDMDVVQAGSTDRGVNFQNAPSHERSFRADASMAADAQHRRSQWAQSAYAAIHWSRSRASG